MKSLHSVFFRFRGCRIPIWLAAASLALPSAGCARKQTLASLPEQLVYVRASDDVPNCGICFSPAKAAEKPLAVIWVHGWGVNFYEPSYVQIGREMAKRGYTTFCVNTRMHDVGFNIGERNGRRIRGGGYWGRQSEQPRDIAAWVSFAVAQGHKRVVLIGHSAGWSAVAQYQAERQDSRIAGLVLASGSVWPSEERPDPKMLADARRLVGEGKGDDLLRFPDGHRKFPSFVSAATFVDIADTPPELRDFFGVRYAKPAVAKVRCPLLAFFGTRDDVGNQKALDLINTCIKRQPTGPARVDGLLISGADHMYTGHEVDVAEAIVHWLQRLQQ